MRSTRSTGAGGGRIYRRSGVRVSLEGEAERVFEAVVRPRENGQGDVAPRSSGCARRSSAASGCSRTSASSRTRPPDVVEAEKDKLEQYRAELDALGG